ncbi:MAG: hypothetical protein WCO56_12140, partial [Verrucomicrobiota bacterium]
LSKIRGRFYASRQVTGNATTSDWKHDIIMVAEYEHTMSLPHSGNCSKLPAVAIHLPLPVLDQVSQ